MSERWLPIPGFVGRYEVSDRGNVRSLASTRVLVTRVLRLQRTPAGRVIVGLYSGGRQKSYAVAPLVALAFIGPKPSDRPYVCHNNGIPTDNRVENLRYDTQAGNCADKKKHGTHQRGERVGTAKLDEVGVRWIRTLRSEGKSFKQIAKVLGVSPSTVGNVVRGDFWRHVT